MKIIFSKKFFSFKSLKKLKFAKTGLLYMSRDPKNRTFSKLDKNGHFWPPKWKCLYQETRVIVYYKKCKKVSKMNSFSTLFTTFQNRWNKNVKKRVPPFLAFLGGLSRVKVPIWPLLGGVPIVLLLLSFNEISARSPKWRYYKGLQGVFLRVPWGAPKWPPEGPFLDPLRPQEGSLGVPHWPRVFQGL